VHGVFPSNRRKLASSQAFQIHQVCVGDSEEIVTPFMQVGTYPTRNFATFGPSELQPPFTVAYLWCNCIIVSLYSTGQVSVSILLIYISQRPVFLLNSRFFLFNDSNLHCCSFSLSYRVILPSSFNTIILTP